MAIGAGQQAAISCQVISFAGARAEIVIGFGYAPLRRAGNSRHLDQAFNAIDAQKEAGHAVIKSQNPAWRGISGKKKGPEMIRALQFGGGGGNRTRVQQLSVVRSTCVASLYFSSKAPGRARIAFAYSL